MAEAQQAANRSELRRKQRAQLDEKMAALKPSEKPKRAKRKKPDPLDVPIAEDADIAPTSNVIDINGFIANAIDPAQEALADAWRIFRQALADSARDNVGPLFTPEFKQAVIHLKQIDEATFHQAREEYKQGTHLNVSSFDKIRKEPDKPKPSTDGPDRPCYAVYDETTDYGKAGVYHHGIKTDREGTPTEFDDYICAPLYIDATSSDGSHKDNYGILLRFKNKRHIWVQWLMPMHMLAGDCLALREQLLNQGLFINHLKKSHIPAYLQWATPEKQLECALKTGWHDDCFVLPDQVIGNRDDIFFQTDGSISADYAAKGTLDDWQRHVSHYAKANPLLLFQISAAFAGPLLKKCHLPYIGFHIFGDSSTGKSTGQEMAVSVWGGKDFQHTWKATGNGLEARAVVHNDNLLALDELGESDPKETAEIIYMIAAGKGKIRANANGKARSTQTWRLALLSNGEKTLAAHVATAGKKVEAGQHARFAEIPVFGDYGAFDHLHGLDSPRLFSDTLKKNAGLHHGTAGIAYLKKLVQDQQDIGDLLAALQTQFTLPDMGSQEGRVAKSFALVATAGELATRYGITGWAQGDATAAAQDCFQHWRKQRGSGDREHNAILEAVRAYIETWGGTRFTDTNTTAIHTQRSGYHKLEAGEKIWLFTKSGLKEATQGHDIKRVCRALIEAGWLQEGQNGHQRQQRIGAENKQERFYFILPNDGTASTG